MGDKFQEGKDGGDRITWPDEENARTVPARLQMIVQVGDEGVLVKAYQDAIVLLGPDEKIRIRRPQG